MSGLGSEGRRSRPVDPSGVTPPERPPSRTLSAPLRVALLLDSLEQPRWVHQALDEATAGGAAQIVGIIRNTAPPATPPRGGRIARWLHNRRHLLYAAYDRADRGQLAGAPDPFEPASIAPLVPGAPILDVVPRQTRDCDYIQDDDIARIRDLEPDLLFRLGFRILRGEILGLPRYGVWSYHHGDPSRFRGGPPGFWEVVERVNVTGSILQVLTEELDGGRVIGRVSTRTQGFSARANRVNLYWKAAPLFARALRTLQETGELPASRGDADFTTYDQRLYKLPANREIAGGFIRMGARYAHSHVRAALTQDDWFIAYRFATHPQADSPNVPYSTMYRFKRIESPPGAFWADPFPVAREGGHHIFCEEFDHGLDRGRIIALEIDRSGLRGPPVPVLEDETHYAYPFTFEWNGDLWMVPENSVRHRIDLYRCRRFPGEWDHAETLLDGVEAVDATIECIDGTWWLFTVMGEQPFPTLDQELSLFHASSPLGPWTPHRANPVKSDIRSTRPGGRLFRMNGEWYRPAQRCTPRYGSAIALNRIARLNEREFEEATIAVIEPSWAPRLIGTHTINACPGLTVIDGLERRRRRRNRSQ